MVSWLSEQYLFCLLGMCLSGTATEVLDFCETVDPCGLAASQARVIP